MGKEFEAPILKKGEGQEILLLAALLTSRLALSGEPAKDPNGKLRVAKYQAVYASKDESELRKTVTDLLAFYGFSAEFMDKLFWDVLFKELPKLKEVVANVFVDGDYESGACERGLKELVRVAKSMETA